MAEYIKREEARLAVMRAGCIGNILPQMESIPAADVVEVVRCRDCEYYENGECDNPHLWTSDGAHVWPSPDHFCGDGKRRADNG